MSAVRYALRNGVAVLHVTSPPVNALGAAVRAGLVSSMERALADPEFEHFTRLVLEQAGVVEGEEAAKA